MSTRARFNKNENEAQPSCVVGIGASAGGLEALQQFLTFLPGDTGMAFVIIQHLSPDHKSLLADILGKDTSMVCLLWKRRTECVWSATTSI